ncbi:YpsA SLOG family protein [Chlorogloea sp. CCALA 695]|uniref:YpsA SLOG family protein n=1 Tax=Chlorogloea sp. CCALA 695 TaxID=2107693 RepID=UPI000D050A0E|nr:hypothetical protein C7B70_25525 [Chlorogloea sp. CCALA 695]
MGIESSVIKEIKFLQVKCLSAYDLTETLSSEYSERTQWNVRDSDGTAVFSISEEIFAGTLLTVELAKKSKKPYIHLCKKLIDVDIVNRFQLFLLELGIVNLNVAGSRASDEPEVYQFVREILDRAFLA